MTLPDIAELVPHTGPALLVSKIVSADAEKLFAKVQVGRGGLFVKNGTVGAWVGLEYMAQSIAAHAGYLAYLDGSPPRIGMLLGTRRYDCQCAFFVEGDILDINVKLLFAVDDSIGSYECVISKMGNTLAKGVLTVFQSVGGIIQDMH
jgi:predicted hotdog family 3-hydroxylacyl-ACP dehydratase